MKICLSLATLTPTWTWRSLPRASAVRAGPGGRRAPGDQRSHRPGGRPQVIAPPGPPRGIVAVIGVHPTAPAHGGIDLEALEALAADPKVGGHRRDRAGFLPPAAPGSGPAGVVSPGN